MLMLTIVTGIAAGAGVLVRALYRFMWIRKMPIDDVRLRLIAGFFKSGPMTFNRNAYRTLLPFAPAVTGFFCLFSDGSLRLQSAAFLAGAVTSVLTGFPGMPGCRDDNRTDYSC